MNRIRVAIVDDESPARRKLAGFIRQEPDMQIAGEAGSGREALEMLRAIGPDVVFLDIQMPQMNGFDVIAALEEPIPVVVFVTAYDEYAVKAFEVNAIDYLLKPFDRSRFLTCLTRVREHLECKPGRDLQSRMEKLLAEMTSRREYLTRLMVKHRGRVIFLRAAEIDRIEASGNYVELHAGTNSYLLRETLNSLGARLDPAQFARVHRSTIVNVDRIREIQPWSHNDYLIVLKDGTEIRMSRRYRDSLAM